jgi:molybdopterin-binding protein
VDEPFVDMEAPVELSARNQIPATVKSVQLGTIMAEVTLTLDGGAEIVAAITRASAERLGLAEGQQVVAVVKATEVMVGLP